MKAGKSIKMVAIVLAGSFLVAAVPDAAVQEQDCEFTTNLYGWYASIGGESATGSNIDIDASDTIDALDFGLMSVFELRKGKWSLLTDVIYLDLDGGGGGVDVGPKGWIVTPVVGYNLIQQGDLTLDVVGGARYLWLEGTVDLSDVGGPRLSDQDHVWDGIVGLKSKVTLAENWYMPFYLDIGAGQSDLTW